MKDNADTNYNGSQESNNILTSLQESVNQNSYQFLPHYLTFLV